LANLVIVSFSFHNSETKTAKGISEIQKFIPDLIENRNFEEMEHLGAFRSTVPDRRPIIGEHHTIANMYVFNGFGTKGISLVPLLTKNLLDHIFENKELMIEINIKRFSKN
ncbi:MAG: FAD-dependent oxidoreductase, partial [Chitinophagales bacterium]